MSITTARKTGRVLIYRGNSSDSIYVATQWIEYEDGRIVAMEKYDDITEQLDKLSESAGGPMVTSFLHSPSVCMKPINDVRCPHSCRSLRHLTKHQFFGDSRVRKRRRVLLMKLHWDRLWRVLGKVAEYTTMFGIGVQAGIYGVHRGWFQ